MRELRALQLLTELLPLLPPPQLLQLLALPQPPVPQTPAVTTTQLTAELLLSIIGSAEWQQYTPPSGLTLVTGVQANYASQAIYSSTAASPMTYGPYTITAQSTADFKTASVALY